MSAQSRLRSGWKAAILAWSRGAPYFASKSDDAVNGEVYVTIMARTLARRVVPPDGVHVDQNSDYSRQAIAEILCALIEKDTTVPAVSLTPIMSEFPAETLILAARLPVEEATPFLEDWYEKRSQPRSSNQGAFSDRAVPFAVIAAMLLAKAPPPGFAASVLAESGERLSFWVADGMWQESRWRGGGAGVCKSADQVFTPTPLAQEELSRWPPLFKYQLQNTAAPYDGTLLVDAGGERISYRRMSIWTTQSFCYQPGVFSDETRHQILAEMLSCG